MRLQVVDDAVRFSCGSCTACCDQPWRTMIEASKAQALDEHDFSAYPQLAGKGFYHKSKAERNPRHGQPDTPRPESLYPLAKGEGSRCLFLDTDGLCIIHKELGPEAKPNMCRQFPLLSARNWVEDRVSVNFGCPSVQKDKGRMLTEQGGEIAEVVTLSDRPARPEASVFLDLLQKITQAECTALLDRAMELFEAGRSKNVWEAFAALCSMLAAAREAEGESARGHGQAEPVRGTQSRGSPIDTTPVVRSYAEPSSAPMPVRLLFAATLYPDTVPPDAVDGLGFFRRLTLIPKLMSLATLSGGYASRLLGRNVSINRVLAHEVEPALPDEATDLLLRYFRSRIWQRTLAGTRLPIVAAVHQHIHDLNAILFFARAEAAEQGVPRLTGEIIRQSLTRVEFHLANQARLYDHTMKGWLKARLCDLDLARESLRLMALNKCGVPIPVQDDSGSSSEPDVS